jgi:hypothetical protein
LQVAKGLLASRASSTIGEQNEDAARAVLKIHDLDVELCLSLVKSFRVTWAMAKDVDGLFRRDHAVEATPTCPPTADDARGDAHVE